MAETPTCFVKNISEETETEGVSAYKVVWFISYKINTLKKKIFLTCSVLRVYFILFVLFKNYFHYFGQLSKIH